MVALEEFCGVNWANRCFESSPETRDHREGIRRFRVQGSGFRVQGSGFRVQGSGFRVQGSGFRV